VPTLVELDIGILALLAAGDILAVVLHDVAFVLHTGLLAALGDTCRLGHVRQLQNHSLVRPYYAEDARNQNDAVVVLQGGP
jgi:hypothetical protein